jgi:hypothetical protein
MCVANPAATAGLFVVDGLHSVRCVMSSTRVLDTPLDANVQSRLLQVFGGYTSNE